jgi:hypothetical protein
MRADRRECLRGGGQTPLPRRPVTVRDWLYRSAGAEFAQIEYLRLEVAPPQAASACR